MVDSDGIEHLPGCAHAQNMARPESLRLVGPRCDCRERLRSLNELNEWLETVDLQEFIDGAGFEKSTRD